MKLRNKKTGEIHEITQVIPLHNMDKKFLIYSKTEGHNHAYKYLAELNEEWEDYEEPKGQIMSIDRDGMIVSIRYSHYEEAEKAVEKLKAWKRLRDYNVKFNLDFVRNRIDFTYSINNALLNVLDGEEQIFNNMKIVFGGEE